MVEHEMEVEDIFQNSLVQSCEMLQAIYKHKGMEGLRKLDMNKVVLSLESIRFLRSIGFVFDKKALLEQTNIGETLCNLISYNILTIKDLSSEQYDSCVTSSKAMKVTKSTFLLMKPGRQARIVTVLLCVRKAYKNQIPKEISWIILDHAFSPKNERGSI